MHSRVVQLVAAVSFLILLLGAAEPPVIEAPEQGERNFTLTSTELTITPGEETAYLRFAGSVTVSSTDASGGGFTISADVVELDVETGEATGNLAINLPDVPEQDERIVSDPGQVIAEMAREMELPRARFSGSSLRRFGAAGNVEVHSAMGVLRTGSLVSTDGGSTWAAEGRSSFRHEVALSPDQAQAIAGIVPIGSDDADAVANSATQTMIVEFAADYLLYDTTGGHALVRGNVVGDLILVGGDGPEPVLHLEAERCEMDLTAQTLAVSEGLRIRAGDLGMCCGELSADLRQGKVLATDGPHLEDRTRGITIDADVIEAAIDGSELIAHGDVLVMAPQQDLRLRAVEVVITRRGEGYHARCRDARATVGLSEFQGERVEVQVIGEKVVVEVRGEQRYRLDLKELEQDSAPES